MLQERYAALLRAVDRRLITLGASSQLKSVPELEHAPFIIHYKEQEGDRRTGTVFLFTPADVLLTSDTIALLAKYVRKQPAKGYIPLLLLEETFMSRIENTLRVAGLWNRVGLASYHRDEIGYQMDWQFPRLTSAPNP